MTTPIKPKALPRELRKWLEGVVAGNCAPQDFEEKDAHAILAALAHERDDEREQCTRVADAEMVAGRKSIVSQRIRARGER